MKIFLKTYIILTVILATFDSCYKETPDYTATDTPTENKYTCPEEEKVLLAAYGENVEVNGMYETEETITVYFSEPFRYYEKTYEKVSIDKTYVESASETQTGITIKFKDHYTIRFEYQKEIALNIATELEFLGYMSEQVEIPFSVNKAGRGKIEFTVKEENGFKPSVEYNWETREGVITFSYNSLPETTDRASIVITDGVAETTYTITATTYHFKVEAQDVLLKGEEGSTAPLSFTIDTDIPEYELEYETEGDFFNFEDGVVTAVSENRTESPRNGQISIFESRRVFSPAVIDIIQESLPAVPPANCIVFNDLNFKNAMVELCDIDGDGEVSFDEALTVEELVANGKGIEDLAGLEYFKNAWKVDLRDNDIKDATILKNLHKLYWLDLKGNYNLKTFDVTTCTQYFEHCAFEVSEDLVYYAFRSQYGVARESDPYFDHSPDVPDPRTTEDWSAHKRMTLVHEHTKTMNSTEMPWITDNQEGMVPSIVFTGLSYIDIDIQDGTWKRLFEQAYGYFFQSSTIGNYLDYIDVYFLEYLMNSREEFYFDPNADRYSEECETALAHLYEKEAELSLYAYETIYGDTEWKISRTNGDKPSKEFPAQLIVRIDNRARKKPYICAEIDGKVLCAFQTIVDIEPENNKCDGREFQYKFIYSTDMRTINNSLCMQNYKEKSIEQLFTNDFKGWDDAYLQFAEIINPE